MNFPAELKYSRDHEWVKMLDETTALVGITDFAQSELGDLVYVNLPEPGDEVLAGEAESCVQDLPARCGQLPALYPGGGKSHRDPRGICNGLYALSGRDQSGHFTGNF